MEYTIEDQFSIDIDWFFIDQQGNVGHVASGGGQFPVSISKSKEMCELLQSFFERYDLVSLNKFSINSELKKIVGFNNSYEETKYLKDFILMAQKGLYSFDKTILGNFIDDNYHLVAKPLNPLNIKMLPDDISIILRRTVIDSDLSILNSLKISDIS